MKKIYILIATVLFSSAVFAQPCIPNTNSLSFDGTSAYVSTNFNSALQITDSITIEAWMNAAAWGATSAKGSIVCHHSWTTGEQGYVLRAGGNGQLSFNLGGIDTNGIPTSWKEVVSTTPVMSLNTWYHVAGTYDGDTLKCYINGNLAGTTAFKGTIVPSTAFNLTIGRLSDLNAGETRFWNGMLDEIRIWHCARTQAELQADMSHHIDPATAVGLVSYWRFNAGAGAIATDLSTSGNNGTILSATWSTNVPFNDSPVAPTIGYTSGFLYSTFAINYQWYYNGTLLTGDTIATYVPTQNGNYYVMVTGTNGCTAMSNVVNITGLGMSDLNNASIFSVKYFTQQKQIEVDINNFSGNESLEILNLLSQKVFEKTITSKTSMIDVSQLSNGTYILSFKSNAGTFVKKILVE